MKNLLPKSFWRFFGASFSPINGGSKPIVVLGMPRSGTSLLSRLVEASGVYFGDLSAMRSADQRNPEGFLELVEMNRLDDRLVSESGFSTHLFAESWFGLRALPSRRISRFFTLRRMTALLRALVREAGPRAWGFKQTPFTFYWWKRFVPHARIIGIYREPRACAESIHRTFGRFTFGQALSWWERGNLELLFHLSQADSILIKFEDLADPKTRLAVLERVAVFCGGEISSFEKIFASGEKRDPISPRFNPETIPLSQRTEEIYRALENVSRESLK